MVEYSIVDILGGIADIGTKATPSDAFGCSLEYGIGGWIGYVGSVPSATFAVLPTQNIGVGSTINVWDAGSASVSYIWNGTSWIKSNPVTYATGTLQEILAGTGIAAKVRALPNDVAGCTLEMGADGLWTGNIGSLTSTQASALQESGELANVASGTGLTQDGIPSTWTGAGVSENAVSTDLHVDGVSLTYAAASAAVQSGGRIILAPGLRIQDFGSALPTGVEIIGDPANKAVFDAFDDTAPTWEKVDGYTNIWSANIDHLWGGTSSAVGATRLSPQIIVGGKMLIEDRGTLDLSTLDASPGHFAVVGLNGGSYATGWYAGAQTYYIYSDSNPNSLATRVAQRAAIGFPSGCSVKNIVMQGGIHRDGLGSRGSYFSDVRIIYPSGHGCILPECKTLRLEVGYANPSADTAIAIHGYSLAPYDLIEHVDAYIHDWGGQFCAAFGSHGDASQVTCAVARIIRPNLERVQQVFSYGDTGYVYCQDMKALDAKTVGEMGSFGTIVRAKWLDRFYSTGTTGLFGLFTGEILDSQFATYHPLFGQGTCTADFTRCSILSGSDLTNNRWAYSLNSSSSISFDKCVVKTNRATASLAFYVAGGGSCAMDITDSRIHDNLTLPSGYTSNGMQRTNPGLSYGQGVDAPIVFSAEEMLEAPFLGDIFVMAATSKLSPTDLVGRLYRNSLDTLSRTIVVSDGQLICYIGGTGNLFAVVDGTNVVKIFGNASGSYDATVSVPGLTAGTATAIASKEDGTFAICDSSGNVHYYNGTTVTSTLVASGFFPTDMMYTTFGPASYKSLYCVLGVLSGLSYVYTSADCVTWTQKPTPASARTFTKLTMDNTGFVVAKGDEYDSIIRYTVDFSTWASFTFQVPIKVIGLTFQPYSSLVYILAYTDASTIVLFVFNHASPGVTQKLVDGITPRGIAIRNWTSGSLSNIGLYSASGRVVQTLDSNTLAATSIRRLQNVYPSKSTSTDSSGLI